MSYQCKDLNYIPIRPDFQVLFSRLQNQVYKSLIGGIGRKRRWRRVNGPEPVSCKPMSLKRSEVRELKNSELDDDHE